MRKLLAMLNLLALVEGGPNANACSCSKNLSPAEALRESPLVFAGQVVSKTSVTLPQILYTKNNAGAVVAFQALARRELVTFKVLRQWRGDTAVSYTVLAATSAEPAPPVEDVIIDCWPPFKIGKQYLVFARAATVDRGFSGGGYAEANFCAPTGLLAINGSTIHELDRLTGKH